MTISIILILPLTARHPILWSLANDLTLFVINMLAHVRVVMDCASLIGLGGVVLAQGFEYHTGIRSGQAQI